MLEGHWLFCQKSAIAGAICGLLFVFIVFKLFSLLDLPVFAPFLFFAGRDRPRGGRKALAHILVYVTFLFSFATQLSRLFG